MPLRGRGSTLLRMVEPTILGAVVDLNGSPRYVHQGWFLISYANLSVILLMIAVFALAIWLPFPGAQKDE